MTPASCSRRSLLKVGALVATPLAAAPVAAAVDGTSARLEDERALRRLHGRLLHGINTGDRDTIAQLFADPARAGIDPAVRQIAADPVGGDDDLLAFDGDGRGASTRFPCSVELASAIPQDCTLARMAHLQGGGFVRRVERRVLTMRCVRTKKGWVIARLDFAAV